MRSLIFLVVLASTPLACKSSTPAQQLQQPQYYPNGQPYYPNGQAQSQPQYYPNGQPVPQQPYPQQPVPQQPYPQQPYPQQPVQRPLLVPLVGAAMQQAEVRAVLGELVNALSPQNQSLVRGIPMQFDPTEEVNAYAGCDDQGSPFLAGTAGILEAVDAISQTKATDELYGTQTYNAYTNAVLPDMVKTQGARAALPAGIIPVQYLADARRWSRAHELFDDIVAFTFGHELGHHYLGHTGCAKGQPFGPGPDPTKLGRLLSVIPTFNQFNEAAADSAGVIDALDAGRARRPQYEWSELGGVTLLDFFARLDTASGNGGLLGLLNPVAFLRTHPNPLARIPLVQAVARTWHQQHP